MQKIIKSIVSLCLACGVSVSVTAVANTAVTASVADAATDYYSDITATHGTALLGQLHDLITSSRTGYSSYADCRDLGATTDPGSKSDTVMEFYTQIDIDKAEWDVYGGWNREHVWPKSDSNGLWKNVSNTTRNGGGDLHHIRPAEKGLNEHRGNLKYGEVTNGKNEYTSKSNVLGGYSTGSNNSGTFEPLDNVKGDVARILMYMYTHYNSYTNAIFEGYAKTNGEKVANYQSSTFGTLNFTHIMTATSESAAIELLLKWNEADPVDSIETTRNDVIYGIQGNRNPFIDHPEYADAIWAISCIEPVEPPVVDPGDPIEPPIIDPGDPIEPPNSQRIEEFKQAVNAIVTEGTLNERLASINNAIAVYRGLTNTDKNATETEIAALKSAIAEYNKTVKAYNNAATEAETAAINSMGGIIKR